MLSSIPELKHYEHIPEIVVKEPISVLTKFAHSRGKPKKPIPTTLFCSEITPIMD